MRSISFNNLSPTEFEEFCFDLLQKLGFFNIDWRKGTGLKTSPADRGRDIVFQREYPDVDGTKYFETWFAECKHYTKGLPPKELQNLLSWGNAERPEGVIIIVSNFLSNSAKDYLENYRKNNKPAYKIRHQLLKNGGHLGKDTPPNILKGAFSAAKKVEKKYGKKGLGPHDDFEWGMINGKLSALRWVLGEDWDMLDT